MSLFGNTPLPRLLHFLGQARLDSIDGNQLGAVAGRGEAGFHDGLSLQGERGPIIVELTGLDLYREIAKLIALLGVRVRLTVLCDTHLPHPRFHLEFATGFNELMIVNRESGFLTGKGHYKVVDLQISFCSAHVGPFLVLRQKRTKETGRDRFFEQQFA